MTTPKASGSRGMTEAYYRRLDHSDDHQVFESTDLTLSNWDPNIQHGSPPLALLTKTIDELLGDTQLRIGRVTLDFLGAIPVSPLRVRTWIERRGRRISLLMSEMTSAED